MSLAIRVLSFVAHRHPQSELVSGLFKKAQMVAAAGRNPVSAAEAALSARATAQDAHAAQSGEAPAQGQSGDATGGEATAA